MAVDKDRTPFDEQWPAVQIAAINEAVKGHTVEELEIYDAGGGHQTVLITFTEGMQLRIECEHLKVVDSIEPQHI